MSRGVPRFRASTRALIVRLMDTSLARGSRRREVNGAVLLEAGTTASASSPPRRGVARATPHPPSRRPGLAPGAGVTVPVASSSSGGGQGRRQAPLLPRRRPGRWPRSKRCAPATLSASPRRTGGLVPPRAGRFLRPVSLRCGLAADPAVCGRLRRRGDRPRCYECDVGNNDARVRLLELDPHADVMRDAVEALVGQVCEPALDPRATLCRPGCRGLRRPAGQADAGHDRSGCIAVGDPGTKREPEAVRRSCLSLHVTYAGVGGAGLRERSGFRATARSGEVDASGSTGVSVIEGDGYAGLAVDMWATTTASAQVSTSIRGPLESRESGDLRPT